MSKINLTSEQVLILEQMHSVTKIRKKADRIKTILFLNRWFSYIETAELLMLDRNTVCKIQTKFNEDWIDNFLEDNYVCYSWKLNEEEINEVKDFVRERYIDDAIEVVNFIKNSFDKTYTRNWITVLLHRIGFTYKKTKQVPAKANREKQEEFIEEYKNIKEGLSNNEKIYFMDWVHPLFNSQSWYCWIEKWTEKEIKSNTGRQRININWAYCVDEQEAIIEVSEKINSQSTIELYKKIIKANPEKNKIYIVRDNAMYYKSSIVKEFLKENPQIIELALPPYSPNLNSIERLWHFFKKKVTYNKYYDNFTDFTKAVEEFFDTWILKYSEKLKTFVTDNFRAIQA